MALDRSNPSPDGDENDILDEEFLAKAFGGTFQGQSNYFLLFFTRNLFLYLLY